LELRQGGTAFDRLDFRKPLFVAGPGLQLLEIEQGERVVVLKEGASTDCRRTQSLRDAHIVN